MVTLATVIDKKYSKQWKLVTKKGYRPNPEPGSLTNRRVKKRLGVREFARMAGISHTHLLCLEQGKRTASSETAEKISAVLANWRKA